MNITVDANNHITGDTYDAAGEVTNDGLSTYTFDAEGRMTAAGGMTYTFDGDGRRVKKSSGTLYWYGAGTSVLAETDLSGNTTNEYIFFGGRMARRDSSGNVYYYFADQIGSSRTITNASGSLCYDADFYPFGGERTPYVNTCAQNYKFAGMERDPETGNDHTQFRQYASNLGRWMSPDPLAGDISNSSGDEPGGPQSLNRYAYASNSPCSMVDTLGLDSCNASVELVNQAGLNANVVAGIEAAVSQIFQASSQGQPNTVGVNFVASAPNDFTLTYNNNGVPGSEKSIVGNVPYPGAYSGQGFANLAPVNYNDLQVIRWLGATGAHELGHGLADVADLPNTDKNVNHLMSWDNNPDYTYFLTNPIVQRPDFPAGLLFTPTQVAAMFSKCKHDQLIVPLPIGGGGGGGNYGGYSGNEFGWLTLIFGAMGGSSTGTITIVTCDPVENPKGCPPAQ